MESEQQSSKKNAAHDILNGQEDTRPTEVHNIAFHQLTLIGNAMADHFVNRTEQSQKNVEPGIS